MLAASAASSSHCSRPARYRPAFATRGSSDLYTATSGTLTFGPGQTVQTITVPILDRAGAAPTRNFNDTLSSSRNQTHAHKAATAKIGANRAIAAASPQLSPPQAALDTEAHR